MIRKVLDINGRPFLIDDSPVAASSGQNTSAGAFLLHDAQDGEQGYPGPRGQDGAAGANGAAGSQGPAGPAIFC